MRNSRCCFVIFVKPGVGIDIVDAVFREDLLPPYVLTLNTDHSSAHLVSGQIADHAGQMGDSLKQICHAAALKVNNEEAHVFGAVVHGQ